MAGRVPCAPPRGSPPSPTDAPRDAPRATLEPARRPVGTRARAPVLRKSWTPRAMSTALVLADAGKRESGRWKRGSVANTESGNSRPRARGSGSRRPKSPQLWGLAPARAWVRLGRRRGVVK